MEAASARLVLQVIAVSAAAVWWWASRTVARGRAERRDPDLAPQGEVTLAGERADLLRRATAALVRGVPGTSLQRVRILEQTPDTVQWQGQAPGAVHDGELRLVAAGSGKWRVQYALQWSAVNGMHRAAGIVLAAGAVAIVALYLLLDQWAVPSDNPGVRGQVWQMFQAGHFLWPPFMLAAVERTVRKQVTTGLATLVHNLPFENG